MGLSVFQRLQEAVSASESIPDIIAEINAMLPEGYCITQRMQPMPEIGGPVDQEDMSDWREWKGGDLITCTDSFPTRLRLGEEYILSGKSEGYVDVYDDTKQISSWYPDRFKFHSRPSKVSK